MSQAGTTSISVTGGALNTLTPDIGGVVSPVLNNIDIHGTNGIVTSNTGAGSLTISGADGLLKSVSVTLTAAELKNLTVASKTILAGQGAGTIIIPFCFNFKLNYGGTTAFVFNAALLDIDYFDGANYFTILPSALQQALIEATANDYQILAGTFGGGSPFTPAQIENLPIVLFNSGPAVTGDAADDSTITLNMQYVVQTL